MDDFKTKVDRAFKRVYDGFTYVDDLEQFGVLEHWAYPEDVENISDDCDGFALACRKSLEEEGIYSRLIICKTESGEWHLVCNTGNLILDNRYPRVMTIESLVNRGYNFKYASGYIRGDDWQVIKGIDRGKV